MPYDLTPRHNKLVFIRYSNDHVTFHLLRYISSVHHVVRRFEMFTNVVSVALDRSGKETSDQPLCWKFYDIERSRNFRRKPLRRALEIFACTVQRQAALVRVWADERSPRSAV